MFQKICGNTVFLVTMLVTGLAHGPSAQNASNAALKRFIKDVPPQMQQQLATPAAKAEIQKAITAKQAVERGLTDTIAVVDTSKPKIQPELGQSIYQKLFRNVQVHPDSAAGNLEIFGQSVFMRGRMTESQLSTAVPASYPVGPGDELMVLIWGRINEEYRLVIDRNGAINIPRIGPITVGGLPFSIMENTITERLQTIEGVKASVTLGKLRTIAVYVVGEVNAPGQYTVSALTGITGILFAAGGPGPMGSLRTIELRRAGKLVRKIDLYDFLLKGDNFSDLRLQPDDVLVVPVVKKVVAVAGNVRRSAIFELDSKSSLRDVLELAGGITPGGWVNRIQIERVFEHQHMTVLDVKADNQTDIPAFTINDGDFIKVLPVTTRDENVVFLEGNVKQPGKYALKPDMRISDIIGSPADLLPEAYFTYAVLQRHQPPDYLARIIPFDLAKVLESPGNDNDLLLQSRDHIIIYHRDFFEPDRSVTIEGSVTTPGKYKLLDNMKVRDLILQAGGLREDASPIRGELYRRNMSGKTVTTDKIEFSIQDAMNNDPSSNLELQRFDRLYIRSVQGWQTEQVVELRGEFMYPGSYVLFEGETLDQLIERAGGFTTDAYLDAAILTRPSVKALEKSRLLEYSRQLERDMIQTAASMAAADNKSGNIMLIMEQQSRLSEELKAVEPLGRIVIDITNRSNYRDFILEQGDVLFVPKNTNTVSVIGEVFNPATFNYHASRPQVGVYVEQTGGTKREADRKNIYVIKANGIVVAGRARKINSSAIKPGDVIVVPQKVSFGSRYMGLSRTLDTIEKIVSIAAASTQIFVTYKLLNP